MPVSSSLTASQFVRRLHRSSHSFASAGSSRGAAANRILGIRREDQSIWERRAPLAPFHVERLTKQGVRILIQPSNRRAYPLQSYVRAGAEAREDISEAPVILGVKQVPVDSLLPNKTYCFFSHTIKAQEANMELLDTVLERRIRLIDYERMVDERDRRVVAFGKFAGVAGMINILHGIGLRLLALGHHTPFMHIGPAHNYRNAGTAKQAIRDTGYEIALGKMPRSMGPLTFVFTGSGNVSQGAQEVFNELPIEYVEPGDLRDAAEQGSTSKVYGTIVTRSDHLVRREGGQVDLEEYNHFPERYESNFSQRIAPYASVIINGLYWPPNAPRLLTIPDAKRLQQPVERAGPSGDSVGSPSLPHRLIAICDISADPNGSIEFMSECSTIDNPFYLYDSLRHSSSNNSFAGDGFLICSIDNMPTQMPLESTDMFGDLLLPYIMDIVRSDATKPVEAHNFSSVVNSAIIASEGSLAPNYQYISELRRARQLDQEAGYKQRGNLKEVLVLGTGHVSAPLVEYLCRDQGLRVTLVSSNQQELVEQSKHAQSRQIANLRTVRMDVHREPDQLAQLVERSNLVVSLLPYRLHPEVARACIKQKKNMLTASYLSAEMAELNEQAREAGISILNEVGLDPGIDHLLAKKAIDEISQQGGRITSLHSYCCGLPTPEFADNPLGYKFGWNPAGAFSVVMNSARWKEADQVLVADEGHLMEHARPVDNFLRALKLEVFPNRDSLHYQQLYDLPDAKTLLRGTMRYAGFSQTINSLKALNLLDRSPHPYLKPGSGAQMSWRQFTADMLGQPQDISLNNLKNIIFDKLGKSETKLQAISDLGLFDDKELVLKCGTPFDTIRTKIINRYPFGAGENDIVIMRIILGVEWPDRRAREERALSLVVYGNEQQGGYSAMAKTVGYPAAIASRMLLEGEIQSKGMVLPLSSEIYNPMLMRLKDEGIFAREE